MAGRLHWAEGWDYGGESEAEYMDYYRRFSGTSNPGTAIYIRSSGGYLTDEGYLNISFNRTHTWSPGAIPETGASILFGICIGNRSPGRAGQFLDFLYGGTSELNIYADSSGYIQVRRGSTVLGTSTNPFNTNDGFHYLTLKVTFHNSSGSFELYIDHNLEASGSGLDTSNGGALKINGMSFSDEWEYYDHMILYDDAGAVPTDDWVVQNLNVDGAGNYSQFSPSAGLNYQNVDEDVMDHDSTYNEDNTVAQRDSYTHANPVLEITETIEGILLYHWIRNIGPGSRTIEPFLRQSAADFDEAAYTPDTASDYRTQITVIKDSPATAANFTATEINNLESGLRVAS